MNPKPTHTKPQSDGAKLHQKEFDKEMNIISLEEVDNELNEKEQSFKKKIFDLAKMEALVHNDEKLSGVYNKMAENGEERYGYHHNETIMNLLFNKYVLGDTRYLNKYKMTNPVKKERRDKAGIEKLQNDIQDKKNNRQPQPEKKQANEDDGTFDTAAYRENRIHKSFDTDNDPMDETTSTGGGSPSSPMTGPDGDPGYAYYAPLGGKKDPKLNKPAWEGGELIKESNYLIDPAGFAKYAEALNEDYINTDNMGDDLDKQKTSQLNKHFSDKSASQLNKDAINDPNPLSLDADEGLDNYSVTPMAEGIDASGLVEYLRDKTGEVPFELGGIKWIEVWAKYPDGRTDIGYYRYGQDLTYSADWFRENMIGNRVNEEGGEDTSKFFQIQTNIGSDDDKMFVEVINQGIDSHLEGFTKSKFYNKVFSIGNRRVLDFHMDEIPILIRRLRDLGTDNSIEWANDIEEHIRKYEAGEVDEGISEADNVSLEQDRAKQLKAAIDGIAQSIKSITTAYQGQDVSDVVQRQTKLKTELEQELQQLQGTKKSFWSKTKDALFNPDKAPDSYGKPRTHFKPKMEGEMNEHHLETTDEKIEFILQNCNGEYNFADLSTKDDAEIDALYRDCETKLYGQDPLGDPNTWNDGNMYIGENVDIEIEDTDRVLDIQEEEIDEKAESKSQQRFMGMVHAAQKGELENPSPEVEKAAKSMSYDDAKDFASTKHKGLPEKVKEAEYDDFSSPEMDKAVGMADKVRGGMSTSNVINFLTAHANVPAGQEEQHIRDFIDANNLTMTDFMDILRRNETQLDDDNKTLLYYAMDDLEDVINNARKKEEPLQEDAFGENPAFHQLMNIMVEITPHLKDDINGLVLQTQRFLKLLGGITAEQALRLFEKNPELKNLRSESVINQEGPKTLETPDTMIQTMKDVPAGGGGISPVGGIGESTDMDRYENVVFAQGEDADEPLNILNNQGEEAALEYLKQWHDFGHHEGTDSIGAGTDDSVFEKDGYIMSYNTRIGYIGLQYDLKHDNTPTPKDALYNNGYDYDSDAFQNLVGESDITEAERKKVPGCKDDEKPIPGKDPAMVGSCEKKDGSGSSSSGKESKYNKEFKKTMEKKRTDNIKKRNPKQFKESFSFDEELTMIDEVKKQMDDLKNISEADKKHPSMVNLERQKKENTKNFDSEMNDSNTGAVISDQAKMKAIDQIEEVGDNPYANGEAIEKEHLKKTGGETFKDEGNSANEAGDEIPKRNLEDDEKEERDLYKGSNGMQGLEYDLEPSEKFEKRMEQDMGEELYKQRNDALENKEKMPRYDKEAVPVKNEGEEPKLVFNTKNSSFKPASIVITEGGTEFKSKNVDGKLIFEAEAEEPLVTGKYRGDNGMTQFVEFRLSEAEEVKETEGMVKLNLDGLGNVYTKVKNNRIEENNEMRDFMNSFEFYFNGTNVVKKQVGKQALMEGEEKKVENVNESIDKMKKLFDYNPAKHVDTSNTRKNAKF